MGMFDDLVPRAATSSGGGGMFDDLIPQQSQRSAVGDFFASIPRGVISGLANTASLSGDAAQIEMGQPLTGPSGPEATKILEQNVTGPLPQPQGMAGRFGASMGEALGTPTSFIGPGGLSLKAGGAALSGLGGQAGEETGLPGGRLLGSLAGGVAANKAFGPTQEVAAIPTRPELKAEAKVDYQRAIDSGFKIDPSALKNFAIGAEQDLINAGHDSDKITRFVQNLQKIPESGDATTSVTAQNLDSIRKYLGRVSRETQPGAPYKPTSDAAAAQAVMGRFKDFIENPPPGSVVAGDPEAYTSAIKSGNANYAAGERVGALDFRANKAQNAAERNVAGSLANQIRSRVGGMVDNPALTRGYTPEEFAQLQKINSGDLGSNIVRQFGRGGALHVIPIGMQLAAAAKTGGMSVPLWAGMVGARLADNAILKSRAQNLSNMLAQRSPLYQNRANALSTTSMLPNQMQLLRSSILGIQ